jgi:hypothetical protein
MTISKRTPTISRYNVTYCFVGATIKRYLLHCTGAHQSVCRVRYCIMCSSYLYNIKRITTPICPYRIFWWWKYIRRPRWIYVPRYRFHDWKRRGLSYSLACNSLAVFFCFSSHTLATCLRADCRRYWHCHCCRVADSCTLLCRNTTRSNNDRRKSGIKIYFVPQYVWRLFRAAVLKLS